MKEVLKNNYMASWYFVSKLCGTFSDKNFSIQKIFIEISIYVLMLCVPILGYIFQRTTVKIEIFLIDNYCILELQAGNINKIRCPVI